MLHLNNSRTFLHQAALFNTFLYINIQLHFKPEINFERSLGLNRKITEYVLFKFKFFFKNSNFTCRHYLSKLGGYLEYLHILLLGPELLIVAFIKLKLFTLSGKGYSFYDLHPHSFFHQVESFFRHKVCFSIGEPSKIKYILSDHVRKGPLTPRP